MKKWISMILVFSMMLGLYGCASTNSRTTEVVDLPENSIYMYYIDSATCELLTEEYALDTAKSNKENITGILQTMFGEKLGSQTNLIAGSMKMIRYSYKEESGLVRITVNVANELNDQYYEVLAKAAITRTLCQLDYIDTVQFEVYDSSTMMENGTTIESYDESSFVDAEDEGGYLQKGVITLYFANESGDMLVEYEKTVEITNNVSLEQLVIESLIEGPMREGYGKTIPEGTILKKVSIKDGVCYVDLSSDFNNTLNTCMDTITIYSVVNSLCKLPTINKVQFLINGEKQSFYREVIPFDGMFEFQRDLIQKEEEEASNQVISKQL